jgi:uncharacterized protein (DUF2249 family)
MSNRLTITPKTRIRELIDAYPELEEKLVEIAPAFGKLKNPVLRNTIARVTSISQAAVIGNVDENHLVNHLRQSVGQEKYSEKLNLNNKTMNQTPSWFSEDKITVSIDARPMLAAGQHPVEVVFSKLAVLENNQILELINAFIPAPLISAAEKKGYQVYLKQMEKDRFLTYFCKV